jgi:hypothetical protein
MQAAPFGALTLAKICKPRGAAPLMEVPAPAIQLHIATSCSLPFTSRPASRVALVPVFLSTKHMT